MFAHAAVAGGSSDFRFVGCCASSTASVVVIDACERQFPGPQRGTLAASPELCGLWWRHDRVETFGR